MNTIDTIILTVILTVLGVLFLQVCMEERNLKKFYKRLEKENKTVDEVKQEMKFNYILEGLK